MAMPRYLKTLSGILVLYFILLGAYGLACLIHFSKDIETGGGSMGPDYFFVYYCLATAYYSAFLVWAFRLYRGKEPSRTAPVELIVIFLLGVCTSVVVIWKYFIPLLHIT
jgi:hypothetical protein